MDIKYICEKITDMSGLPVRLYENGQLQAFYATVPLVKDPSILISKALSSSSRNIEYMYDEYSNYYGIMNHGTVRIVIGPSRTDAYTTQMLHDMAFDLDVSNQGKDSFFKAMKAIVHMPIMSIIQILSTIYYVLSENRISIEELFPEIEPLPAQNSVEASHEDIYKAYQIERNLCNMVEKGNTRELNQFFSNTPSLKTGTLSSDSLRQLKNTFIVSTTLFCRSAIKGGLDVTQAFQLSDQYIQKMESLSTYEQITSLQVQMLKDYTNRVHELPKATSRLQNEIYLYISSHISDTITTEALADYLYMSRSYLSTQFKKETGMNLIDYIHSIKIDRAKALLKTTSKSITAIADYLAFASPSHFSKVFSETVHMSPKQYRNSGQV